MTVLVVPESNLPQVASRICTSKVFFRNSPLPIEQDSIPLQAPFGFIMHSSDRGVGKCFGEVLATQDQAKTQSSCNLDYFGTSALKNYPPVN